MKSSSKYLAGFVIFFLMPFAVVAQAANNTLPALIPLPVAIKQSAASFYINPATKIIAGNKALQKITALLNDYVIAAGGKRLMVTTTTPVNNFISIEIDSTEIPNKEGYRLLIDEKAIRCIGHDAGGVLYGLQTLRQLWSAGKTKIKVPGCTIDDYPRFEYRSMALDVSRHLFPVSFIKKYINLLALYKFNTFHWHLTDDQGWRIEIKKYPKLQSVAAWRNETLIGHKKELPHRFDGKRYGGYYTQEQIKEVVQYAADRQISIIPEIEMPGHATAALAAYPALGCTGGPYKTATFWGVFDDVYCAGNDSTFSFLQNVLDEVMALFPSIYIHIGGDECPKTRWKACTKCQQRKQALGLQDEHALQSYFIQRMEKYLNSKGRQIIGWDEILEGGLAPNATVMSWRGEEGGKAAIAQHHRVIMTPESHCYFDYYQSLYAEEPLAAGGFTPLQKVYGYEPLASSTDSMNATYLAGVEGQAWSEYYTSTAKATYMIFPRALALAELAWTPVALRNYDNFLSRLRHQKLLQQQEGVNYSNLFDEISYTATPAQNNTVQVTLQSALPGGEIRYTTDNSVPTLQSALYTGTINIKNTSTIKALLFDKRKQPVGRLFHQYLRIHKAVGAQAVIKNKPIDRFNPGAAALVNGLFGSNRYNDGQWIGFGGSDLHAVIDLGSVQTIHRLGLNVLNYHWQRMWAPVSLQLLASTDGEHFTELHRQNSFPMNGINKLDVPVKPVQARYIKVIGVNKGVIPAGEYGAGGNALLLIDEVIIE
ncbi:beta-hexosaminidase [Niastella caeni]|uniref:beta-N-acetylhexosaminidase n=1 Tax=Niastella caeni TaxID=2569763 RepID=A0A4S8I404_9BACT|nr:family 20 glycosylhydrolase [Niastella caeni]THU41112.1 beta-hexosaminidase [Niastella caeni]